MSTGGTRRQLTPAQQTHILSDIQQHQHRFAAQPTNQLFNPNVNKNFGKSSIVVEPSINTQLPTETTVYQLSPQQSFVPIQTSLAQPQSQPLQSHRFRQPPSGPHSQHHTQTNFVPNFNSQPNHITFPQQPLFERQNTPSLVQQPPQPNAQTVFQRSTASQQGDHSFKPSQPFPATQQTFEQFTQNNFGKPAAPIQTLQNQIFQTPFSQNSGNPPQTPTHNLAPPAINQYTQFKFNPQPPQIQQQQYFQEEARLKDLIERQKIIQKHEQFVQRQYQKQQQKVRQMHEDFVQRQRRIKEQSIANANPNTNYFPQNSKARVVSQYDSAAFEKALETYQVVPTTQSPTTIAEASSPVIRVKSSRANSKGDLSEDELEKLLTNHREKILNHLRQQENDKPSKKNKVKPTKAFGREDLLQQLKLALADQPADLGDKNYTSMDLVLPDGQKVQVIRTSDPNLVHGATPLNDDGQLLSQISAQQLVREPPQEQKPLQEQIADSSLLPPGSNFEVIKQTADGNLQPVASLPDQKKVTFVYLEELDDGSLRVQGVKANGEKEAKTKGAEVDSIIDRIKKGEIQLPSTANDQTKSSASPSTTRATATPSSTAIFSQSTKFESSSPTTRFSSSVTPSPPVQYVSTASPSVQFVSSASPYSTLNTVSSETTFRLTASPSTNFALTTPRSTPTRSQTTRGISTSFPHTASTAHIRSSSTVSQQSSASTLSQVHTTPTQPPQNELSTILKNNGLHAMAKYLKQSGLDSILNETGPYTVFAPSDKAFKSLLVQLGGPDRADEKFKANPRLLSGVSFLLCFQIIHQIYF